MSKRQDKLRRKSSRSFDGSQVIELHGGKFDEERNPPAVKPLNPTQADYLDALKRSPQVVVLGPAGTGKTWIAATHAADLFRQRVLMKD